VYRRQGSRLSFTTPGMRGERNNSRDENSWQLH
jgi:hypothetical protein